MKKAWLPVVSLVLVSVVIGLAGCSQGSLSPSIVPSNLRLSLNSQEEGIWVNGTGKVSVVPDIALLRLGIESQETSVAMAQTQAAEAMDKVMTALSNNGVAEKDIQTQYFNIQRVTRWDDRKGQEIVLGYRVTNLVTAKIREMKKAGAIIDALATAGGDLTRIDGISFTVEDPTANYEQARQKAMTDAGAKAKQLAELAGVKLGKPRYISESAYFPTPIYRQEFFEKAAGAPMVQTPISPGEMEIVLNVQLVYAVLD